MVTAGIKEARQHFTEYLVKVESGEEVIITRRSEPIAPKSKPLSQVVISSREGESV